MFAEPGTSVWALFKRAAGDSGKTSPLLTSTDTDWHRELRNELVGSVGTKTLKVLTAFDQSPTDFLVYGYWGYPRYIALAGIWKPCIRVRLFT